MSRYTVVWLQEATDVGALDQRTHGTRRLKSAQKVRRQSTLGSHAVTVLVCGTSKLTQHDTAAADL